ncbi:hypothetical protein EV649_3665 [Kribbella sp. VKM Ac-2569]|uniref:hypothetical protein n=1 Tax=Kribbella sp. VKM Ac-2569 TaxID=2512220 RepID=UPI00102AAAF7|nr:hypothetical protein [Kribbella sp. VKM Ac-2569]RZT20518.1 hypothetical protein EV649_3665 [Kribbella sp. VKM Ac-2569]
MNERGPEILPGTWEHDWVSSVVAKAEEYAGRPSRWNGKLYEQPGPVAGVCLPDGSMTISREHVLDPARPAYTPGRTLTSDERHAAASATTMAVFNARLSMSEVGDDSMPGATPIESLEDIALENARCDQFSREYSGRIAESMTDQSLDLGFQAPTFPAYSAATDRLLYTLGGATGMSHSQLGDLIDSTARTQRFNAIADRALDHQVGELIPESHRAQLREDLTGPLRRGLGGLTMTEMSELTHPGSKHKWGWDSAEWTEVEFTTNLGDIKEHYESWNAEHPGVEPPELPDSLRERFLDREEEIQQVWASKGWPAQQPVAGREKEYYERLPEQVYPNAREQEIAKLQQFLWSHTAPSQRQDSAVDTGGRPDNVRQIGSARKPDRGVE